MCQCVFANNRVSFLKGGDRVLKERPGTSTIQ